MVTWSLKFNWNNIFLKKIPEVLLEKLDCETFSQKAGYQQKKTVFYFWTFISIFKTNLLFYILAFLWQLKIETRTKVKVKLIIFHYCIPLLLDSCLKYFFSLYLTSIQNTKLHSEKGTKNYNDSKIIIMLLYCISFHLYSSKNVLGHCRKRKQKAENKV